MLKQDVSFLQQLLQPQKVIVDMRQPYYKKAIVKFCFRVIQNKYFEAFIFVVIILNTFTLALD